MTSLSHTTPVHNQCRTWFHRQPLKQWKFKVSFTPQTQIRKEKLRHVMLAKVRCADRKDRRCQSRIENAKMLCSPWLCSLTDMFTPDRKSGVDGLPKQRRCKAGNVSVVIYLSTTNPPRPQPAAGHYSGRNKSSYYQKWQAWTTQGRKKRKR